MNANNGIISGVLVTVGDLARVVSIMIIFTLIYELFFIYCRVLVVGFCLGGVWMGAMWKVLSTVLAYKIFEEFGNVSECKMCRGSCLSFNLFSDMTIFLISLGLLLCVFFGQSLWGGGVHLFNSLM